MWSGFQAKKLKTCRERELAPNQAEPENQAGYIPGTDPVINNFNILLQKIEPDPLLVQHIKGQPAVSTYVQEKGGITFYSIRETPCRMSFGDSICYWSVIGPCRESWPLTLLTRPQAKFFWGFQLPGPVTFSRLDSTFLLKKNNLARQSLRTAPFLGRNVPYREDVQVGRKCRVIVKSNPINKITLQAFLHCHNLSSETPAPILECKRTHFCVLPRNSEEIFTSHGLN